MKLRGFDNFSGFQTTGADTQTLHCAGNIGANGWNYQSERLRFDASIDVRLTKHYALYATGRNIFNDRDQNEAYAIGSPRYVKFAAEGEYGVNFQFGVKGTF